LGSELYGELLDCAAVDLEAGGVTWRVLEGREADPPGSARALRFLGTVHRLALEGRAPELAALYPSCGGEALGAGLWPAFVRTVEAHQAELRELATRPVQTNEVGRSTALVGGFLEVARRTELPLRILELGASAGLNLRWDHFRFEARGATWGEPGSPVRLCDFNTDTPPPFDTGAMVVERAGCDARPIDPATDEGRITLMSYVWPDQTHRLRLLRGALVVAERVPARVDRADAVDWLSSGLETVGEGAATVVFHSILLPYLSEDARAHLRELMHEAGERATASAPIAWLRMEPAGEVANVHLTLWPGGDERLVATAGYHGRAVRWLGYRARHD
jgi:hypothetical protein